MNGSLFSELLVITFCTIEQKRSKHRQTNSVIDLKILAALNLKSGQMFLQEKKKHTDSFLCSRSKKSNDEMATSDGTDKTSLPVLLKAIQSIYLVSG